MDQEDYGVDVGLFLVLLVIVSVILTGIIVIYDTSIVFSVNEPYRCYVIPDGYTVVGVSASSLYATVDEKGVVAAFRFGDLETIECSVSSASGEVTNG